MQLVKTISGLLIFCFSTCFNSSTAYSLADQKNSHYACISFLTEKLRDSCFSWSESTYPNMSSQDQSMAEAINHTPPRSSINLYLPKPEQESFWSKNLMSLAALVLSLLTAVLTTAQFTKSRNRSIRDDFWVRQIINPRFIQPYLDFIQWCSQNIPQPSKKNENIDCFRSDFNKRWNDISNSSAILEVLKPAKANKAKKNHPHEVTEALEKIQDETMCYLALCLEETASTDNYNHYLGSLQKASHLTLKEIHDWQHTM